MSQGSGRQAVRRGVDVTTVLPVIGQRCGAGSAPRLLRPYVPRRSLSRRCFRPAAALQQSTCDLGKWGVLIRRRCTQQLCFPCRALGNTSGIKGRLSTALDVQRCERKGAPLRGITQQSHPRWGAGGAGGVHARQNTGKPVSVARRPGGAVTPPLRWGTAL